ncbi:hypothetical protein F5B21DRAFT_508311 [Xylaria acuta]|nr:hypothetical protein F5B21DRAFT_508311 [Xylaria acuta]
MSRICAVFAATPAKAVGGRYEDTGWKLVAATRSISSQWSKPSPGQDGRAAGNGNVDRRFALFKAMDECVCRWRERNEDRSKKGNAALVRMGESGDAMFMTAT